MAAIISARRLFVSLRFSLGGTFSVSSDGCVVTSRIDFWESAHGAMIHVSSVAEIATLVHMGWVLLNRINNYA